MPNPRLPYCRLHNRTGAGRHYSVRLRVWSDTRGDPNLYSAPAYFGTALGLRASPGGSSAHTTTWAAPWITAPTERNQLRLAFELPIDKVVSRVRVYHATAGYSTVFLNGGHTREHTCCTLHAAPTYTNPIHPSNPTLPPPHALRGAAATGHPVRIATAVHRSLCDGGVHQKIHTTMACIIALLTCRQRPRLHARPCA